MEKPAAKRIMERSGKEKRHILVENYLASHSLVESNIRSFNDFIERRMQEIVDDINKNIPREEIDLELGRIEVGEPSIKEADGSLTLLTPTEARLRNITYSAPVYLEITLRMDGQQETQRVEIGRIPIMVKSKVCPVSRMTKEEMIKAGIDPLDPGGYFIINGNERVMVLTEDLAENQPFIEKTAGKLQLRLFSQRGSYRIPITINEKTDGIIQITFSRFRNIPAIILLKALGLTKEADIAKYVGKKSDLLIVNLYEFANIATAEEAMLKIAELAGFHGTKKEILDRINQRLDAYFLPHIGTDKKDRIEKAITLCKMIKQFLIAKENPELVTDKDHYANKRVRLSGDMMASLFRVNLNSLVRDMIHSLQKYHRRGKVFGIKSIAKATLFSHRIESAIATGNWVGERTGVTQNMDKTNYLAVMSQLQRVTSMLSGQQENFLARTLHPTHYGRFCPIETPEGTEIGLRKNLALLAKISTAVVFDEANFIELLSELGAETGENKHEGKTDIFYNGKFIGSTNEAERLVSELRKRRRKGELPGEMSIRYDDTYDIIYISTEVGRVMRPLIIVENGKPKLTDEHLRLVEEGKLNWEDLVKEGIIEYIDAAEEENCLVAVYEHELTNEHTHLEIDTIAFLGLVTSLVPYANHDQSSRLNRGSKTQKQALGLYAANFLSRIDTDVSILHYPQKPIVRSFVYDYLDFYPAGQNMVVAIMTLDGYNIEDAIILNKGSVDRGLARSTYFRPYSTVERSYPGGLKDSICVPDKDTTGYRTEQNYRFLEEDGIAYPEAELREGEVVIGKVSPPKFLSEAREITIRTKKEASEVIRQEEKGIVDAVFITEDSEGNKVVHVRTRDLRIPELGDKFSTSHGQKGVVGYIVPEENMPFSARGIKPDIIFNPHGIPSRMTVGYLIELLAGKVGCLSGKIIDGTPFSGQTIEELEQQLKELGFRYDGKETFYNGITGEALEAKIYVGNMYYLKLKYMVSNKIHARASGKVTLLTRQPVEGRAHGGALRLGEMEQQALVAHGASLLLKERYDSDKVIVHVCMECGALGIKDHIRNKLYCPLCGSKKIEPVELSYAFKLLVDELQSMHILTKFELKNKYEE